MALRLFVPLFAVFAIFLYLAYLNPGSVPFIYAPGKQISLPNIALVMLSFAAGAFCLSFVYFLRSFGDAISDIQKYFEKMKTRKVENRLMEAEQVIAQGKGDRALKLVEKVLRGRPDHFDALVLKGKILRESGNTEEALHAHSLAHAIKPEELDIVFHLKDDYRAMGQWKAAYNLLEQVRGRSPKDTGLLLEMRELAEKMSDFKRGIALQKEIIKLLPDKNSQKEQRKNLADLYCLHAEQLEKVEKWTLAKKELYAAGKIEPDFTTAAMMLSDIALKQSNNREAEKILTREFKSTGSLIALHGLEKVYIASGKQEEIAKLYKWAETIVPEEKILPLFTIMAHIDMAHIEKSDTGAAKEILEKTAEQLDHLALYHLALGVVQIKDGGENSAGENSFKKALENEWSNFLRYRCSSCRLEMKDYFGKCPSCSEWNSAKAVYGNVSTGTGLIKKS